MTFPPQYQPAPGGNAGWNPPPPPPQGPQLSEHVGDLVWIKVKEFLPQYPFPFGVKDGIRVDFEVLEGRTEVGELQSDVTLSNVVLVKQLAPGVGREYFGRIATGRGANANPPVHLDPPRAGDERVIEAYLARKQGGPAQPPAAPQPTPYAPAQPQAYQPGYPAPGPAQYPSNGQAPQAYPAQPQPQYAQPQYAQPSGMPAAAPPPRYSDPAPF